MDEDELRARLAVVVPEAPSAPERAEAARVRAIRLRRRAVVMAVAAAVVVAVAVPVGLFVGGEERAADPATVDHLRFDCPGDPAPRRLESPSGTVSPIGTDAVLVRMCSLSGFGDHQVPMDGLDEPGAVLFARRLRALTPGKEPRVCELVRRPSYAYLVGYADGSTRFLTSTGGSCGGVFIDGYRIGNGAASDALLELFKTELVAKRVRLGGPPGKIAPPLGRQCGAHPLDEKVLSFSILDPDPDEIRFATLCVPRSGNSEQQVKQIELSEADAEILENDLRSHLLPGSEYQATSCNLTFNPPWLIAVNLWGDRFQLRSDCAGRYPLQRFEPGDRGRFWSPGDAAREILDRLAGDTATKLDLPTSSTSPDEVVTVWADLLNVGDDRANGLWLRDPPSTSGHVTLKVTSLRPEGSPVIDYAWAHAVEVDVIFADGTTADCGDYVERTFTLVRATESEPWRISSWRDKNGPIDDAGGSAAC